ncbi:MAG: glycosyltransferase family 1 protein [Deltaproteobacteria bacterium]|nr:glycosyltransferase family 1 protein [Deltaproteobacteria bacterium]
MKILVIGTPKRHSGSHLPGFDNVLLGLKGWGAGLDHYPNILTQSLSGIGDYEFKFKGSDISYPEYHAVEDNLKKGHYGLIITTVSRVDYMAGKHGLISRVTREFKYSLEANKHKLGGTIVTDWIKEGVRLPPFIVIDDTDDPFIWSVNLDLLLNCRLYFKRELPFDRFFCFRMFESQLKNEKKVELADKLRPCWISYDRELVSRFFDINNLKPYAERGLDINFICDPFTNHIRTRTLRFLEGIEGRHKIATARSGRLGRQEFYKLLCDSKIGISLPGRGWDCFRHYEVLLSGALLFATRPSIEFARPLKDGENCVFIESDLSDLEGKLKFYLGNPSAAQKIAGKGNELARGSMHNGKLAEYIMETLKGADVL